MKIPILLNLVCTQELRDVHLTLLTSIIGLGAQKVRMSRTPVINKHLEIEDPDQEFDQLQENEVEVQANDMMDALNGSWVPLSRAYTGKTLGARAIGKNSPKNMLAKFGSLLDLPDKYRGHVYCYWEKLYYDQLTQKLIEALRKYRDSMNNLKMAKVRSLFYDR